MPAWRSSCDSNLTWLRPFVKNRYMLGVFARRRTESLVNPGNPLNLIRIAPA